MSIPHICILLKRFSAMFIILAALAAGAVVIAYAETGEMKQSRLKMNHRLSESPSPFRSSAAVRAKMRAGNTVTSRGICPHVFHLQNHTG